ncbi:MAG: hypothetical protein ACR652_22590 [Methylocystis sp.]|uniref:hypothetical protein n=1 Tax=Methylocystis sp. TaxID=1911079 RepID=UPI003DA37D0A
MYWDPSRSNTVPSTPPQGQGPQNNAGLNPNTGVRVQWQQGGALPPHPPAQGQSQQAQRYGRRLDQEQGRPLSGRTVTPESANNNSTAQTQNRNQPGTPFNARARSYVPPYVINNAVTSGMQFAQGALQDVNFMLSLYPSSMLESLRSFLGAPCVPMCDTNIGGQLAESVSAQPEKASDEKFLRSETHRLLRFNACQAAVATETLMIEMKFAGADAWDPGLKNQILTQSMLRFPQIISGQLSAKTVIMQELARIGRYLPVSQQMVTIDDNFVRQRASGRTGDLKGLYGDAVCDALAKVGLQPPPIFLSPARKNAIFACIRDATRQRDGAGIQERVEVQLVAGAKETSRFMGTFLNRMSALPKEILSNSDELNSLFNGYLTDCGNIYSESSNAAPENAAFEKTLSRATIRATEMEKAARLAEKEGRERAQKSLESFSQECRNTLAFIPSGKTISLSALYPSGLKSSLEAFLGKPGADLPQVRLSAMEQQRLETEIQRSFREDAPGDRVGHMSDWSQNLLREAATRSAGVMETLMKDPELAQLQGDAKAQAFWAKFETAMQ